MFHNMARLRGTRIVATDGEIGEFTGLVFDEESWQICCLALDTGHWLGDRQVLISADRFQSLQGLGEKLHVEVTRDQIRNSLGVSKADSESGQMGKLSMFDYTRHLHSTDEVRGYTVHAIDGDIGHVADFIFDDESWIIRWLVVDTGSWWPGRKVLLSSEWIESMNWHDNKVFVTVSRESIKTAPGCEPLELPGRDCEEKVFAHYNKPCYWIPLDVVREPRL